MFKFEPNKSFRMKKYIITSIALLTLVACDMQAGGNKNIVKRSATQPRYNDNLTAAETEPDFSPDQSKRPAITDSARMSGATEVSQDANVMPVAEDNTTAEEAMQEASSNE